MKTTKLLILTSLISLNTVFAQQRDSRAPEATPVQIEATVDYLGNFFWSIPILEKAFINTKPADRKDEIIVGELGIDGGNKAMILKLAQEIADTLHGKFDSFLISHKGKLIFESYYARGRVNLPHHQASATKSYTSFLLGRAIQLGYLSMADLDKPLVSFLKDLDPTKFVAGAEKITLHNALTMSSGIRISEEQREELNKNPNQLKGQGRVQALLEHSTPITEESQSFKYGIGPGLIMQVIDAIVPGGAIDFIKNEFLNKLGINTYGWHINEVTGMPESGWKVSMTSRAMTKLGQLVINKGIWNGEQLVPAVYITKAINRIVRHSDDENFSDNGSISNTGYGYFWWQADMKYGNNNYFSTSARGGGGQFIILIEELDLVVVTTAHNNRDNSILQIIADRILPAFIK